MPAESASAISATLTGEIPREEFKRRFDDRSLVVVDVLPDASYAAGHIPNALSLPLGEIHARAREVLPDLDANIVAYCRGFT